MSKTHDIFISYSRKDTDIVNRVLKELISEGFSVWIDRNGVESGDAFKSVIVKAIENCNTVIFFSSQSSNESYWTTKEISVAIYEGKNIIPIKLDDSKYNSEIKFDLINLDYIDMTSPSLEREGVKRLIKSLKNRKVTVIENNDITLDEEKNKNDRKSNLKFLFQYNGCLVSITLCLVGIIIAPFLFEIYNSPNEASIQSSPSEGLLADLPVTFSKDGFILDVIYDESDYAFAICDSIACDMDSPQEFDYPELEAPEYIRFMKEGVEYVRKGAYNEAYCQFLKAANMDFADAMYNVSVCHLTGLGAEVDTIKAIQWLQKANELYNEPAKIKLEMLNKERKR